MRSEHMGMSAYSWQYSVTTNDWITANPILEMRTARHRADIALVWLKGFQSRQFTFKSCATGCCLHGLAVRQLRSIGWLRINLARRGWSSIRAVLWPP